MYEEIHALEKFVERNKTKISYVINADYNVCVYINGLDRKIKFSSILCDLNGCGATYDEACKDFVKNILNPKWNLHYKNSKGFITTKIRNEIAELLKEEYSKNEEKY